MLWNFVALGGATLALILSAARSAPPSLRAWRAAVGLVAIGMVAVRVYLGIPVAAEGLGFAWFGLEFWFQAEGEGRRYTEQTGLGSVAENAKRARLVAVVFILIGLIAVFGKVIWG